MSDQIKVNRKNMLANFFDQVLQKRFERMQKALAEAKDYVDNRTPFTGQHTSEARQAKLAIMRKLKMKSGKVYRRYIKKQRAIGREMDRHGA